MNVDLTREEARYLSILAAQDLRQDHDRGAHARVIGDIHQPAWAKLQPACEWEQDS